MSGNTIGRVTAILAAGALVAALATITLDTPASAAKPKCQGKVATIVGTKKADVLKGTRKRDIIVAKGGNDRIYGKGGNDLICAGTGHDLVVGGPGADVLWGQFGNDRLHGGPGPDFLAGQVGNDTLNGGLGVDTCFQGTGTGLWANCEIPVPVPPEPPTLVIAYSDVNTNHVYDAGDVMIAKIVDTIEDGKIGPGDTIKMGQYPTSPNVIKPAQLRSQFEDWRVKEHTVTSEDREADADAVVVTAVGGTHVWVRPSATIDVDQYVEEAIAATDASVLVDQQTASNADHLIYDVGSQSRPSGELTLSGTGAGDDGFIDVDIYIP